MAPAGDGRAHGRRDVGAERETHTHREGPAQAGDSAASPGPGHSAAQMAST